MITLVPELTPNRHGMLRIWDPPRDRAEYVIGADTSEGKVRDKGAGKRKFNYMDDRPDYSAAIVLELESGLHVATWHGYLPPDEYASVLAALGFHYNNALIVPEINGPGLVVVTRLTDTIRYPNVYQTRIFNSSAKDPWIPQWGWRTTVDTRQLLVSRINEAVNPGRLFTRDRTLIAELRTMEFDDNGTPRARGKNKDDNVLALGMALQGRFERLSGLQGEVAPKSTNRDYDDMVWAKVKAQREQRENDRLRDRLRAARGRGFGWRGPLGRR